MRFIYVLKNLINEKVYVGQTKNPKQRRATHFYTAKRNIKYPLYRSIRKHGAENFSFEVIEECDDTVINEREQFWIVHFSSFNPEKGYNLTNGGEGASNYKHTKEHRKRLMGNTFGKGHHHTVDARKRMSVARRGKSKTREWINKINKANMKAVQLIDTNGLIHSFESATEASQKTGVPRSTICVGCKTRRIINGNTWSMCVA